MCVKAWSQEKQVLNLHQLQKMKVKSLTFWDKYPIIAITGWPSFNKTLTLSCYLFRQFPVVVMCLRIDLTKNQAAKVQKIKNTSKMFAKIQEFKLQDVVKETMDRPVTVITNVRHPLTCSQSQWHKKKDPKVFTASQNEWTNSTQVIKNKFRTLKLA